ncbi:MAG: AMIN domain-containing protein, partial [Acidobacteria bacterium]
PASPPPPAGALLDVVVASGEGWVEVRLVADGQLLYSHLSLVDPPRFAVDLRGVINRVAQSSLPAGGELVERVRVAQFTRRPPVTRVVLDLHRGDLEPRIEEIAGGLLIRVVAR